MATPHLRTFGCPRRATPTKTQGDPIKPWSARSVETCVLVPLEG